MLPWSVERAGCFHEHVVVSEALRGNPLGDPFERPLWVYTPPGYDDERERRYPSIYVVQGYAYHLLHWHNRVQFRLSYPDLVDEAMATGEFPPAIVVFVDAWTSYGGSQYLDSAGTGRYHTYLIEDVVRFVDEQYRTLAARDHRGIQGKSSGGYGAMVTAMLSPDVFGGLATHSGDGLFDVCYIPVFRVMARILRDRYHGSVEAFLADFRSRVPLTRDYDNQFMETIGDAAAYSPDENGKPQFPFDLVTGELIDDVWQRWLAWDPIRMAEQPDYAEALRSMRAIYIDAGDRDEHFLDLAAEAFKQRVAAAGVPDERVFYELFDGTHWWTEYRYPLSLAFLSERLSQ